MSVRYNRTEAGRARESFPAGCGLVRAGVVRRGDLVYSWTSCEWLAADDPTWTQGPPIGSFIPDLIAVARPGHVEQRGPADVTARNAEAGVSRATTPPTASRSSSAQGSLF